MAFIIGTFIKVKLACHKLIKEYSDLKNIRGKILFNHLGFPLDSTLHQVVRREFALSDSSLHLTHCFLLSSLIHKQIKQCYLSHVQIAKSFPLYLSVPITNHFLLVSTPAPCQYAKPPTSSILHSSWWTLDSIYRLLLLKQKVQLGQETFSGALLDQLF